jgi:hypothetical protein
LTCPAANALESREREEISEGGEDRTDGVVGEVKVGQIR